MEFNSPFYFILLVLIPLIFFFYHKTNFLKEKSFKISSIIIIKQAIKNQKIKIFQLPFYLKLISLFFLIISLSGPTINHILPSKEGIEIILAVDTSISMWFLDDEKEIMKVVGHDRINGVIRKIYKDFTGQLKQRIKIAKKVIINFVNKRSTDKIGLVIFKAQGITLTPPTMQQKYLINLVKNLNLSMINQDGTAIGDALGISINALRYSKSKNKIIILITDGNDNQENQVNNILTQIDAAKIASYNKIKIYTVGMGGKNKVFAPYSLEKSLLLNYKKYEESKYFIEYGKEQMNEFPLKMISKITGGKFYRANNENELKFIYNDIDKLEKSKLDEHYSIKKQEVYSYTLIFSLLFIFIALILEFTILRILP